MYQTNPIVDTRLQAQSILYLAIITPLLLLLCYPHAAHAQDKSGVKPQVISLPSGPGSLEGLGETFEPDLSSGTASFPVKFTAAPGRAGLQPNLELAYNGGNGNGPWGMGWKLSIPSIQRRTENGLPSYDDSRDEFIYNDGEKLVPLADGTYRFENEGRFMRFRRLEGGGWEAHSPDGMRFLFGEEENSRVVTPQGIFRWELARQIDPNGNELVYSYQHDDGYVYPSAIRYNQGATGADSAVIFHYAPRPDPFTDRRSGAPITQALRGTRLEMTALGKLVRAYNFAYAPEQSTGKYSLLSSVTQVGDDGSSTLPPHQFTYTQFDPTQSQVVTMQNPPPLGLTNPDADLVDINADGLPDLAYTAAEGHRFYLNRGKGRWQTEPIYPAQSPPERISSPNVRMADMNGDGRVDLLVKSGATTGAPFYFYTNNNNGEWEKDGRVDFGPSPGFDLNDPNVQLFDVNNDHRIDVVLSTAGRLKIWLAREGTWSSTADFDVPAPAAGDAAKFSDPNIKVGDITGDRMEDLLFVREGQVVFWAHNGNGNYTEGETLLNPPTGVGTQAAQIQAGDLNNDGLVDLVLPGNRTVYYWLSLGDGSLTAPIVLRDTPPFNAEDTAVRLADIDGDGAVELIYSRYPAPANEAMQYVDFSVGAQPFLLQSVDNGLGRTIQIDYKSSVDDYIADWDAETPWQVNLPFPVQVVRQVKVQDANSGDDYVIDYHYRDGYYDGGQKEFRGFVRSEEIKRGDPTAPSTVTRHTYDVGMVDESRKGLLLTKEVLAEGGACSGDFTGCFERTVNQLTTLVVVAPGETRTNKPIAYAYLSQADRFVHEQQAQPVQLRQTYEQDSYGNLTKEFNYGQVCGEDLSCGDDELLKYTDYAYNLEAWLLNRPQRVYQTDETGAFVSHQRFYYDGAAYVGLPLGGITRGQLTLQESGLGPAGENRYIVTKSHAYDQYGNVIGIIDANGNRTTVEYDAQLHTFPVLEQLHLSDGNVLSYAAIYHPGLGKPMAATDYNGQPMFFVYDTFSRLHKIVEPGDTLELPTQQFSYAIGSPRSAITTEQRVQSGGNDVLTSVTYYDGLGRKLQTRREAADNKVVVEEAVTYNARQSVYQQFQPYYADGFAYQPPPAAQPKNMLYYDAMSRVVRTENPDGTYSSIIHRPLAQVQRDEEDNRADSPHANTPTTLVYDGLQRLISVEETNLVNGQRTPITTRYGYDLQGNLTQMVDGQGNTRTMRYDGLGRKLHLQEPNRGTIDYTYDDNGNLIRTVDTKGQVVETQYDAANRPVRETLHYTDGRPTEVNAIYHYDSDLETRYPGAQNTLGRLAYIEDQAGTIHYAYDARGNVIASLRHFREEGYTFVTRTRFDAMNRVSQVIYPDGTALDYEYDAGGLLQRIPGIVDKIEYTPANQRANITYANGVVSSYGYDARLRLTALDARRGSEPLQALGYTFDGASNLRSMVDTRAAAGGLPSAQTQTFDYDALYRLTSATGVYGQIDYGYDAIGNLVRKTSTGTPDTPNQNLGELRYGENGAGPHALTSAGDVTYRYDANGNLVSDGRRSYTWNAKDQLVATDMGSTQTSYTYNAEGQRVRQAVRLGAAVSSTLYVGENVEVRDDRLIFYIFDDEERIAQISKSFEPTTLLTSFDSPAPGSPPSSPPLPAALQWYLSDHLGSTNLLLDAQGAVLREQVYYPYGPLRYRLNGGPVDYGYAGKELDHSGLHYFGGRYYDANTGHFISVDPVVQEYGGNPQQNEALLNYLTHPQMANGYSYAAGNPLKYIDPDGREIVISKALRQTPGFMKAWKLFKSTHEGQRLIASLEKSGWTVHLRANLGGRDGKVGYGLQPGERSYNFAGNASVTQYKNLGATEAAVLINIKEHTNQFRAKDQLITELGNTIHRELRQSEAWSQTSIGEFLRNMENKRPDKFYDTMEALDNGTEAHHLAFQQEMKTALRQKQK